MIPPYTHLKNALAASNVSTVANTTDVEAGKIPLIYATGNHEFPIGATDTTICKTALDVFGEQMGCEQNSHNVINGIHFITSGGKDYSSDAKHQEAWIKAEIENAKTANTNNPIFLVLHHPTGDSGKYSADFIAYLNENPNVIVLSAHTHLAVQNAKGIWQGGYTTVTSGYMCGGNQSYSQGFLVEVTGSVVKFFKMDLNEVAYIDEPWVVDITDLSDYTESGRAN